MKNLESQSAEFRVKDTTADETTDTTAGDAESRYCYHGFFAQQLLALIKAELKLG